jgi:hypothetical protein
MNGWASPPAPTWPPSWGPPAPARPLPPPTHSALRRMRRPPSPLGTPPPLRSSIMVAETFCMLMLLGEGEAALHQSRPAGGRRAGKGNWGSGWMGSRRSGAGPHIPGRGEARSCSPELLVLYMLGRRGCLLQQPCLLLGAGCPRSCRHSKWLVRRACFTRRADYSWNHEAVQELFRQRAATLTLCSELFLAYINTGWILWRNLNFIKSNETWCPASASMRRAVHEGCLVCSASSSSAASTSAPSSNVPSSAQPPPAAREEARPAPYVPDRRPREPEVSEEKKKLAASLFGGGTSTSSRGAGKAAPRPTTKTKLAEGGRAGAPTKSVPGPQAEVNLLDFGSDTEAPPAPAAAPPADPFKQLEGLSIADPSYTTTAPPPLAAAHAKPAFDLASLYGGPSPVGSVAGGANMSGRPTSPIRGVVDKGPSQAGNERSNSVSSVASKSQQVQKAGVVPQNPDIFQDLLG